MTTPEVSSCPLCHSLDPARHPADIDGRAWICPDKWHTTLERIEGHWLVEEVAGETVPLIDLRGVAGWGTLEALVLREAAERWDAIQTKPNDHYSRRDAALWLHNEADYLSTSPDDGACADCGRIDGGCDREAMRPVSTPYRVTFRDRAAHRLASFALRLATPEYGAYLRVVTARGQASLLDALVNDEVTP